MTTETQVAGADEFAALLETIGTVTATNATMVKALDDASDYVMGDDGKPKMGADGKPMRKEAPAGGDGGGEMMGKAFKATLSDGSEVEGLDATDILKALDTDMGVLRKALPSLVRALGTQGNLIKSLQDEVATLRTSGAGRRAMLSVSDRTSVLEQPASNTAGKLTPGEFMAKALDASNDGVISSLDCARLEASINRGLQPDPGLAQIVLSHKK